MIILGISCFYHDSACAIIKDGIILYASQEERFTRIKHDFSFPFQAIKNSLKFCKYNLDKIDAIVFYEKPLLKIDRLIETSLATAPKGFNLFRKFIPLWFKEKLFQKTL